MSFLPVWERFPMFEAQILSFWTALICVIQLYFVFDSKYTVCKRLVREGNTDN